MVVSALLMVASDGVQTPTNEVVALTNEVAPPVLESEPAVLEDAAPSHEPTISSNAPVLVVPPPAPAPDLLPAVEALSQRIAALERALTRQGRSAQDERLETQQMLYFVAGCVGGALLLGILLAALILARALRQVSGVVATQLSLVPRALPPPPEVPALRSGELAMEPARGAVEEVSDRFVRAIERLEKRIVELEHSARQAGKEAGAGGNGAAESAPAEAGKSTSGASELRFSVLQQKQYPEGQSWAGTAPKPGEETTLWLNKGQALLDAGQAEQALACFEKAVERNPHVADVHVKRGLALEKLQKLEAALESYDRAIAANPGLTLAYLHKGAVFNRLQRHQEALACYEAALRTEQAQAVQAGSG